RGVSRETSVFYANGLSYEAIIAVRLCLREECLHALSGTTVKLMFSRLAVREIPATNLSNLNGTLQPNNCPFTCFTCNLVRSIIVHFRPDENYGSRGWIYSKVTQ